jgi:transcriptional regulator with XRE-family HTH domain
MMGNLQVSRHLSSPRTVQMSTPHQDNWNPLVGDRIQALLRRNRLAGVEPSTQIALAKAAGISRQTLSTAMNGRITPAVAEKIAAALNVSGADVIGSDAPARVVRESPLEDYAPPVMQGLPLAIRVWIQEFLLEVTKAGATEQEVDAARKLLTSPELHTVWTGGQPRDLSEEEWLMGLRASGDFIRAEMKKRGRKFPQK